MGKILAVSLVLTAVSYGVTPALFAQSKTKNNPLPPKEKAVYHVKQETGGRILDVKQLTKSGSAVWRVKFLKDGRIRYMDVAPQTFTK